MRPLLRMCARMLNYSNVCRNRLYLTLLNCIHMVGISKVYLCVFLQFAGDFFLVLHVLIT